MKILILFILLIAMPAWADESEPALALPVHEASSLSEPATGSEPVTSEPAAAKPEESTVKEETPVATDAPAPEAVEAEEAALPEESADAQKEGSIQADEAASLSTDTATSVSVDPAFPGVANSAPTPIEELAPAAQSAQGETPVLDYGPSSEEGYGVVELKNGGHIMQVDHDDSPNLVDKGEEKKADMTSAGKDTSL